MSAGKKRGGVGRRIGAGRHPAAQQGGEVQMPKTASLIAGAIALGLISAGTAAAEPLKVAHSTWVGYGPLYVAQEKGFFDEEGLEVELIVMEDPKVRFPALAAGQIDVAVSTVDTVLNYLSDQQGYRICSRSTIPRAATASSPIRTSRAWPISRAGRSLMPRARSRSSISASC
jgi:ABC-type amino acid transport substrate-binding protein